MYSAPQLFELDLVWGGAAPPPAAIGVTGLTGIVAAGQLQADPPPLQHHKGPRHRAGTAIGDVDRIHSPVVDFGQQRFAITEVVLRSRTRPSFSFSKG